MCSIPRVMLVLLLMAPVATAQTVHTFTYDPPADQRIERGVWVAGDFNNWSADALRMKKSDDGVYRAKVKLSEGVYHYKFVIDGEHWVNDPDSNQALEESDGHGGVNSAVLIGVDARQLPDPRPNHIRSQALQHDPADRLDQNVVSDRLVMLTLRTQADDVQRVTAHLRGRGGDRSLPMHVIRTRLGFDRYGVMVRLDGDALRYRFTVSDGTATRTVEPSSGWYRATAPPAFETPDWAKHAVWYQIFPERFRNGRESNDPEGAYAWTVDWWQTLPGESAQPGNFYRGQGDVWQRRFGGDLQGIREKLPYLKKLGVDAIYLNPIFEGESLHKYDATDYRHVDDNFGIKGDLPIEGEGPSPDTWQWSKSDRVFLDFIEQAHAQGFKVIIDGVFNHVGTQHRYFQDVLEKGRDSRYADWFQIISWGSGGEPGTPDGIQWKAWDGKNGSLPAFRKHPELGLARGPREHVFAITRRWMAPNGDPSKGVDGWRLDVPMHIPHPFWRDWRELVKSIDEDAYITGEVWSPADAWLKGDQFDGVMNYQFAMAGQDFLIDEQTRVSPDTFLQRLGRVVYRYPLQASLVNLNLYDSHDTDRLASMFANPDRPYDRGNRLQDDGTDYDITEPSERERRRMRQAVSVQMSFLGAPMIYYGDEAGMWGPDDPSNRQPMVWRDLEPYDGKNVAFHESVFSHYQRAIAVRRALPTLRLGLYRPLKARGDRAVVMFARDLERSRVYVAINRTAQPQRLTVPVDAVAREREFFNWLDASQVRIERSAETGNRPLAVAREKAGGYSATDGTISVELEAFSTAILAPQPRGEEPGSE